MKYYKINDDIIYKTEAGIRRKKSDHKYYQKFDFRYGRITGTYTLFGTFFGIMNMSNLLTTIKFVTGTILVRLHRFEGRIIIMFQQNVQKY